MTSSDISIDGNLDKENILPMASPSLKSLPLKAVDMNKANKEKRYASLSSIELGDDFTSKAVLKRLRLQIAEKDKLVNILQSQVYQKDNTIQELQVEMTKTKQQKLEMKKLVTKQQSNDFRLKVHKKILEDKLQNFVKRDENKLRRANYKREELEAELSQMEEDFETTILKIANERSTEKREWEEHISALNESYKANLSDFSNEISSLSEKLQQLIELNQSLHQEKITKDLCIQSQEQKINELNKVNLNFSIQLKRKEKEIVIRSAKHKEKLIEIEIEKTENNKKNQRLGSTIIQMQKDLIGEREKFQQNLSDMEMVKSRLEHSIETKTSLSQQISHASNDRDSLLLKINDMEIERNAIVNILRDKDSQLFDIQKQMLILSTQNESLNKVLSEMQSQMSEIETEASHINDLVKERDVEIDALKGKERQLVDIQKQMLILSSQNESLKKVLSEMQSQMSEKETERNNFILNMDENKMCIESLRELNVRMESCYQAQIDSLETKRKGNEEELVHKLDNLSKENYQLQSNLSKVSSKFEEMKNENEIILSRLQNQEQKAETVKVGNPMSSSTSSSSLTDFITASKSKSMSKLAAKKQVLK